MLCWLHLSVRAFQFLLIGFAFLGLQVFALGNASPVYAKAADDNAISGGEIVSIETSASKPDIHLLANETCFPIDRIVISDVALVAAKTLEKKIQPLAYDCLGNTLAKSILVAINGLYAKRGYITTQAYLPKQDIKASREFHLVIRVGRVGHVQYQERPEWSRGSYGARLSENASRMFSAKKPIGFFASLDALLEAIDDPLEAPLLRTPRARTFGALVAERGEALNIERLQQGLDQMNRAPSSRAEVKLKPGQDATTSDLHISNKPTDAFRMTVGVDTLGTEATGIERGLITIARDNLVGVNDTWNFGLTSAENSNQITANIAVPYKWMTLSAYASYSDASIPITPVVDLFSQTGEVTVAAGMTLVRTPEHRIDGTLGARVAVNKRYINDVRLTPTQIFAAQGTVSHRWMIGRTAQLSTSLKGEMGLDGLGATEDILGAGDNAPSSKFRKIEGSVTLAWQLVDGIRLFSQVQGQWTNAPLFSLDQLTVGSTSSVRGFKNVPLSVDQGGLTRNELSARLPVDQVLDPLGFKDQIWLKNRFRAFEGYAFLDAGHGRDIANAFDDTIVGAGLGLRYRDGRITADVSFAQPLYRDNPFFEKQREYYLSVSVKTF